MPVSIGFPPRTGQQGQKANVKQLLSRIFYLSNSNELYCMDMTSEGCTYSSCEYSRIAQTILEVFYLFLRSQRPTYVPMSVKGRLACAPTANAEQQPIKGCGITLVKKDIESFFSAPWIQPLGRGEDGNWTDRA